MSSRGFFFLIAIMTAVYSSVFRSGDFWAEKLGYHPRTLDSIVEAQVGDWSSPIDSIDFIFYDSAQADYEFGIKAVCNYCHVEGRWQDVYIELDADLVEANLVFANGLRVKSKLDRSYIEDGEFADQEYSWIFKLLDENRVVEIHFDHGKSVSWISVHNIVPCTENVSNYRFGNEYFKYERTYAHFNQVLK